MVKHCSNSLYGNCSEILMIVHLVIVWLVLLKLYHPLTNQSEMICCHSDTVTLISSNFFRTLSHLFFPPHISSCLPLLPLSLSCLLIIKLSQERPDKEEVLIVGSMYDEAIFIQHDIFYRFNPTHMQHLFYVVKKRGISANWHRSFMKSNFISLIESVLSPSFALW